MKNFVVFLRYEKTRLFAFKINWPLSCLQRCERTIFWSDARKGGFFTEKKYCIGACQILKLWNQKLSAKLSRTFYDWTCHHNIFLLLFLSVNIIFPLRVLTLADSNKMYSCKKITTTQIQISRQNCNGFFWNISHQMII